MPGRRPRAAVAVPGIRCATIYRFGILLVPGHANPAVAVRSLTM